MLVMVWAGELAIKAQADELQPFARPIVERLVPILAQGMNMPRSIVENRWERCLLCCEHRSFLHFEVKDVHYRQYVLLIINHSDQRSRSSYDDYGNGWLHVCTPCHRE
jgi:hypothetical protein